MKGVVEVFGAPVSHLLTEFERALAAVLDDIVNLVLLNDGTISSLGLDKQTEVVLYNYASPFLDDLSAPDFCAALGLDDFWRNLAHGLRD